MTDDCDIHSGRTSIGDAFAKAERLLEEGRIGLVGVPDGEPQAFTYSYGRAALGMPEIIVMGMSPTQAAVLINIAHAVPITEPGISTEVIEPFDVLFIGASDDAKELMSMSRRYAEEFEVLQMLWPDREGRHPIDPDYDAEQFPQTVFAHF